MRFRLTLLIFSLLLTLTTQGQELTIKSMQATNDLSASQNRRVDRNNEPCGLVKVRLATTGATFEGNVIQPVEYKTGEYWVYMTKGSKELHVKHPSFLPIEVHFGDYGLSKGIQALTTYTLILVMPQIAGMDVDDGNRFLAMTVEPKDAMVYIDNQLQRLQDGSLSILLPMGQHQYRVEAPACESKSGSFVIGNETSRLTVRLESTMASLNISSTIQGTQIYINDQLKGTSVWSGSLPPGTYRVEGRLSGYRNYRQSVTLAQHDNKQITIPQLIAMTGALSVNYQPIDAEVWIDGKKAGTSPNVFRNLLVGKHSIKLRANGYTSKQLQTTIEEGKTSTISGSLDKVSVSTSSIDNSLSAEALFDRGCNYLYGTGNKTKDYAKALEYFQVAANRGHSNSQVNLGFMYDQGMGVPQDYSEAAKWYLKAAEQGNPMGQNNIGYLYMTGLGVEQNYQEALKWYNKAIAQGGMGLFSEQHVGWMYLNGYGVNQNYSKALKLIEKGVQKNYRYAQYYYGFMYEHGYAVKKDLNEAKRWYKKAADQGNEMARQQLENLK